MIYPKEGSMPRKNCACIVDASWVSEDQVEASRQWIEFIREDEQQRTFMAAGFRPGTDLDLNYPGSKISSRFGLDPNEPKVVLNPSETPPEVAAAIDGNWEQVKKRGIVTFVVDTSGSMMGGKLRQAKDGLNRAFDSMAKSNQVGFLSFDDTICEGRRDNVPPGRSSAEVWRLKTVPPVAFNQERQNLIEGGLDVQGGDVPASSQGLLCRRDERSRGCAGIRTAPGHGAQDAQVLGTSRVSTRPTA